MVKRLWVLVLALLPVLAFAQTGKVNEYGWQVPDKTITISFYAGKDNPETVAKNTPQMDRFLLEKFNVKIQKIVYDTDMDERLSLMLASGDYPDVLACSLTDVQFRPWVTQKKAVELSGLIDKNGPNVKKELGSLYKRYFETDGKLYGVPSGWGFLGIPDYSAHIRWDWWQAMGAPAFKTTEDYYQILKKMQALHPTNKNGEKTYAIAWQPNLAPERVTGYWGLKDGWKEDAGSNLTYWLNTKEGLDMALYFNRFNVEGLMDPDSFVSKYDDWKAKFSGERIMGHIGSWWVSWNAGHEIWQKTNPDWTDDQRFVQVKLQAPGVSTVYLSPKDVMGSGRTIITNKAKNPADIVKWWNFEITPMGTRLLGWGVPNLEKSNWKVNADGSWAFNDFARDTMISGKYDFTLGDSFGGGQYWQVMPIKFSSEKRPTTVWWDQNFNQDTKWKKIMADNMAGTQWDNTAIMEIKIASDSKMAFIKQQIKDIVTTGFAKAVMAPSAAECTAEFNNMVKAAKKAGLDEYQKFITDEYKKNLKAWK
jgi:putative aldouronate transport system substrate-binding protein